MDQIQYDLIVVWWLVNFAANLCHKHGSSYFNIYQSIYSSGIGDLIIYCVRWDEGLSFR